MRCFFSTEKEFQFICKEEDHFLVALFTIHLRKRNEYLVEKFENIRCFHYKSTITMCYHVLHNSIMYKVRIGRSIEIQ